MKTAERKACMQTCDGRLIIGYGEFESFEEAPRSGIAFYLNDYALSDSRPWKVPSDVLVGEEAEAWLREQRAEEDVKVEWDSLKPEDFAVVFAEITEAIQSGVLQKSVPVTVERGRMVEGDSWSLLQKLIQQKEAFCPYAWVDGDRGFCGLTPEVLFSLRKGRLQTMALAGTARADEAEVFAWDQKEICEHEFVAETLVSKLGELGMVKRGERQVMNLGSLVHFHTPIEVGMYNDYSVEMLMKKLHPTPALGPLPRSESTLKLLYEWRDRAGCPDYFGAPFGVLEEGVFHSVVMIRGVHWKGAEVVIPSGCGVIEASGLTNEWRELALKRKAVKKMFGLD